MENIFLNGSIDFYFKTTEILVFDQSSFSTTFVKKNSSFYTPKKCIFSFAHKYKMRKVDSDISMFTFNLCRLTLYDYRFLIHFKIEIKAEIVIALIAFKRIDLHKMKESIIYSK